jgi:hypothetical protein
MNIIVSELSLKNENLKETSSSSSFLLAMSKFCDELFVFVFMYIRPLKSTEDEERDGNEAKVICFHSPASKKENHENQHNFPFGAFFTLERFSIQQQRKNFTCVDHQTHRMVFMVF